MPPPEELLPALPYSINLVNSEQATRDVYYINGRGSIFTYRPTKRALTLLIGGVLLTPLFYLLAFSNQVMWTFLLCLAGAGTILALLIFLYMAYKYFKWNNSVRACIREVAKQKNAVLHLHSNSFELASDDNSVIEKCEQINKVSITKAYILFYIGPEVWYLFPAASMTPVEFDVLTQYVRSKMKEPSPQNPIPPSS